MFGLHRPKYSLVLDITLEELWITGRELAEDPRLGSVRSAMESVMNDNHVTDVAHGLLTVGSSIRREWHHNAGDFKTIRELTAQLQLPLDADRNRFIGAFFSHAQHRQLLSVNIVTTEGRATQYEVGPFVRWMRKMCGLWKFFSAFRNADNKPLNEAIADLIIPHRV